MLKAYLFRIKKGGRGGGEYSAKKGKKAYNQLIMTIVKTLILLRH